MTYILGFAFRLRRYFRPVKDSSYLCWIRRFPCVACYSTRRIEAAHIGPRGHGQKVSDCLALPLCFKCHQDGANALHKVGPDRFQVLYSLDFASLQAMFNHFYLLQHGRSAKGWEVEQERRAAA
jgi:hypothetical protein